MRVACTSDIHNNLISKNILPDADVLCISGDLTLFRKYDYGTQAYFINEGLFRWCESLKEKYKKILFCFGNHDGCGEHWPDEIRVADNACLLNDSGATVDGVNFWGTPWTVPFCGWHFMAGNEKRNEKFSLIPENTDVLLSHGPPRLGKLDECVDGHKAGDSVLMDHIKRVKPKLCVCGHIHEGSGQVNILNGTKIANCSYVDLGYNEKFEDGVFVFDI